MTKAKGSFVAGWWTWWPTSGDRYARRFSTEKDATEYIPTIKTKHGLPIPLGPKVVMNVKWGSEENPFAWGYDEPIVYSQDEVLKMFLSQGEAA